MKPKNLEKNKEQGYDLRFKDDQLLETGNFVLSHVFWTDMEKYANKALFKLQNDHPGIRFDFKILEQPKTKDEKKNEFVDYMQSQHPKIDIEKVYDLVDEVFTKFKDENVIKDNPNPFFKFPLNSDIVKALVINVLSKYK